MGIAIAVAAAAAAVLRLLYPHAQCTTFAYQKSKWKCDKCPLKGLEPFALDSPPKWGCHMHKIQPLLDSFRLTLLRLSGAHALSLFAEIME